MPKTGTIIGAVLPVLIFAAGPAFAGVGGSITPTYPAGPVHIGDTFVASLTITNDSDGANGSDAISVSNILHTPSCGAAAAPCKAFDPGVFRVSNGTGSSACAGVEFNAAIADSSTGEVQFVPTRGWALGPAKSGGVAATCEIKFTVTVLKNPVRDSSSKAGLQTTSVARATFSGANPAQRGLGIGSSTTTFGPAP